MKGFTFRRKANGSRSEGFTLAELIISVAVAALVGGLLISIFVSNTGLFYRESSRITEGVGINDSLSSIRSWVKQAQAVAGSFSSYSSGPSELVLQVASIDSSGNILSNVYDYIVYTVSQGRLYLKVFPDATSSRKSLDQILTNNIDSVVFNYFDSSGNTITPLSAVRVRVSITLSQKSGAQNETSVATSEASLRND